MHFDFFVSNDSVASYDVHIKTTFFRGASGDLLSLAWFSIFCNENPGKYCSNVALLYGNRLNKLTLSVSPRKILKNMLFFTELTLPPPPPNRFGLSTYISQDDIGNSEKCLFWPREHPVDGGTINESRIASTACTQCITGRAHRQSNS